MQNPYYTEFLSRKDKLSEETIKKYCRKFNYRGIDVDIAPFTDNAETVIQDFGALFNNIILFFIDAKTTLYLFKKPFGT